MGQQSVRQAARRSALNAQAVLLHKQRADPEPRLEALAVAVLTALGERDAAVRDPERAPAARLAMNHDEGFVREAVEWCGSGVTLRDVTRLRRLADLHWGGSGKVNAPGSVQRV
jgi:hypothetical protein